MTYDQAQSARLGQKVGLENPGIRLVEDVSDVEAPYIGQLVYVTSSGVLMIWSGALWAEISGGTGGGGGLGLIESFPTPSVAWVTTHNFGQTPVDVLLMDSLGAQIMGNISFPDGNHARADFNIAVAGYMLVQK